jgi:branched-chain amino acid transport system ATP-binding protein
MAATLLKVKGLQVAYGGIQAVKGVDFEVHEGELVSLIGSNGAGKTSTMKAITGSLPLHAGDIEYLGQSIVGQGPWDLVKQGLAMVPEGRGVFTRMTIIENLLMGAYSRRDNPQREIDAIYQRFPNLAARRDMLASVLSGGEQQMLAIGRALLSKPALMMLDEPSLGLSPLLVQALFGLLKDLNRDGLSILLVEQNTHMALATAHRAYVLELGRMVLQGNAQDIAADPRMAAAYLGA